jgi:heme-degrading monooxygenase HmoA
MYAVITTVGLQPDRIDDVREVYRRTNPDLVASQEDWVSAVFAADRKNDTITVIARWKSAESYKEFADGQEYRSAMGELARYFRGKPSVEINEILVEV